jgi:D-3-phosphoglycerate dehydrogenase / 2-oxoglutarate reductase
MTEKLKILISTSSFGKCGCKPIDLLEENNCQIILNPYGRKLKPEEVIALGKDCIGIIAGVESLDAMILESLPKLRCISRCGSGIDNVDLKKAEELNIVVKSAPSGPTRAVAELTIGLIFDVLRCISLRDRLIRCGQWPKDMGFLLKGKKVGVLGLGRIGKNVAELLSKLDADIIGFDNKPDMSWVKNNKIKLVEFDELFKQCDILCVHVSFSDDNRHLVGEKEIKSMKKGSFVINLSRGGVVDENILYKMLKNKHLSGAAIDVFEKEPYIGPLTELDNVVLTPHIGSYAKEARLDMEIEAVKNLLDVIN